MSSLSDDELIEVYRSPYADELLSFDSVTSEELTKPVCVTIDGETVEVTLAVPSRDAQGITRRDSQGRVIPRRTTVYDVAVALSKADCIPTLCHQQHMTPVGVCRVCSVLECRNGRSPPRLVPACRHPVTDKMEIHTRRSEAVVTIGDERQPAGEFVDRSVRLLIELLAARNLHYDQKPGQVWYRNELLELAAASGYATAAAGSASPYPQPGTLPANRTLPVATRDLHDGTCGISLNSRFARTEYRINPNGAATGLKTHDISSGVLLVDHNLCILCDRCVRGCHEVKPFRILGHSGFGHEARISFDLDDRAAGSDCVSCGECAVSCPTGALTFNATIYEGNPRLRADAWAEHPEPRPVTVPAEELRKLPLFKTVPFAFLKWTEGSVGRLVCGTADEPVVLCEKDEYGTTAFVIEKGEVEVEVPDGTLVRTPKNVIVGEMACMSHLPRTATLTLRPGGSVLVVRRNVLHMLLRTPRNKRFFRKVFRNRALHDTLRNTELFKGLKPPQVAACLKLLKMRRKEVGLLSLEPGQAVFRQGDEADAFYVIYSGHVKVEQVMSGGGEFVRDYPLGPRSHFGEIGLMSGDRSKAPGTPISEAVAGRLKPGSRGVRTGNCVALDDVQLLRVEKAVFEDMLALDPEIGRHFENICLQLIAKNARVIPNLDRYSLTTQFVDRGLHQGQNLLTIDTTSCTRCLECVKACSDVHAAEDHAPSRFGFFYDLFRTGVTRLDFTGPRIDRFFVPHACRSCHDPACLDGCPVDAIHRRPTKDGKKQMAIVIEDHCIGCGLCEWNCPFDSIHMADRFIGGSKKPRPVATNCDLCEEKAGIPRCVNACPHDAAWRGDATEFAKKLGIDAPPG
jgi:ferredoxin